MKLASLIIRCERLLSRRSEVVRAVHLCPRYPHAVSTIRLIGWCRWKSHLM